MDASGHGVSEADINALHILFNGTLHKRQQRYARFLELVADWGIEARAIVGIHYQSVELNVENQIPSVARGNGGDDERIITLRDSA